MSDEKDDIRSGFVRQRRNLIVTSLVLLFALIHQVQPIQTINLPGAPINFGHAVAVEPYLWIMFWYFAWRYYVYFRDIGDKGFKGPLHIRLNRLAYRHAWRLFQTDPTIRDGLQADLETDLKRQQVGAHSGSAIPTSKESWDLREVNIHGQVELRHITVAMRFMTALHEGKDRQWANQKNRRLDIIESDAARLHLRAGLYVLTHTRILSEYFLPFGIATLPVLYGAYRLAVGTA